jgi:hypothetical protein
VGWDSVKKRSDDCRAGSVGTVPLSLHILQLTLSYETIHRRGSIQDIMNALRHSHCGDWRAAVVES